MNLSSISKHWDANQRGPQAGLVLPAEKDRWLALIGDVDKYALSRNPLKYGALSIAGYLHARTGQHRIMNNERWSLPPEQIAQLLVACGITIDQVPSTLQEHYLADLHRADPEDLLTLQHTILTTLGKRPDPIDALELLAGIPPKRYDEYDNKVRDDATLRALVPFCHGAQDQTDLAASLLTDPLVCLERYGQNSYLTAIAYHFPLANQGMLAEQCVAFDDYQALAFLVEQNRLPLAEWISYVAASVERVPLSRAETKSHSQSLDSADQEARQQEILDSFAVLGRSHTPEDWVQAIGASINATPDLVTRILNMGPCPEVDFDGWLAWGCVWAAYGLCDASHPVLAEQIDSAALVIKTALNGKPPASLPIISASSTLPVSWFLRADNPVLAVSPAIRDLVARRFLFGWETPDFNTLWSIPPSRLWFKNADISDVLCYRWDTKSFRESWEWILALLPSLEQTAWPGLGARIAQACGSKALTARNVRALWKDKNPNYFGPVIPAQYKNEAMILYALVRKDPDGINAMASALGVSPSSETYRSIVVQWIEQSLCGAAIENDNVLLPDLKN